MAAQDYYVMLGVASDANPDEIKRAYRKLANELHPDRNPAEESEGRFKDITLAYQTLSSAARRKRYDEERVRLTRRLILWKGPPKRGRGEDLSYRLDVSFEDAVRGSTTSIQVPRKATCGECGGSGAATDRAPSRIPPCADCGGRGKLAEGGRATRPCERCQGRGLEPIEACGTCGGEGRRDQTETLEVPIPGGIESGRRLRLSGWGDDGPGGGDNGILYVVVTVIDHPLLKRNGDDIVGEVPISFAQSLLGAEVRVATADGPATVKVPPNSGPGTTLKIKGKGVLRPDGKRGDQIVTVAVILPGDLTTAQREALAAFAAVRPPAEEAPIRRFHEKLVKLFPGEG